MIGLGLFEPPASLLAWFYSWSHNYIIAISLMAVVVMAVVTPLNLKMTKSMLEMQRLQPEMRKLQQQHRGDRQKLNEEMMKLYQEHKVNPLASCLPLLIQFPVFIIMYRVLHGLTVMAPGTNRFDPKYISKSSDLYRDLHTKTEMLTWGLDLALRPYHVVADSFGKGLVYIALVMVLGAVYFIQQRMVASRAVMSPTMSAGQQKLMQYLPVVFAVFLFFYVTGLIIYYLAQALLRIAQQYYITKRFYHGEESLGRQAQAAGARAREIHKSDPDGGTGGGIFAQARRDLGNQRDAGPAKKSDSSATGAGSKRTTPAKNRPTTNRPAPTGRAGRPSSGRAGGGNSRQQRPPKKK